MDDQPDGAARRRLSGPDAHQRLAGLLFMFLAMAGSLSGPYSAGWGSRATAPA
ncbi:MAG: hypothetical protein ACYC8V_16270 [Caulobacteraceae bacterium]